MDFVFDSLASGRRIKCLTVTDDFSECVDISVDHGIGGEYVVRVLDQVARFRGYPQAVRTDQGPEFTSRAFMAWAQAKGVRHILNQPGKPTQNAYIESVNGSTASSAVRRLLQTATTPRPCSRAATVRR